MLLFTCLTITSTALYMRQNLLFVVIVVLNGIYIGTISLGVNYFIALGFRRGYTSYIYPFLIMFIFIYEGIYIMKCFYYLQRFKQHAEYQCEK